MTTLAESYIKGGIYVSKQLMQGPYKKEDIYRALKTQGYKQECSHMKFYNVGDTVVETGRAIQRGNWGGGGHWAMIMNWDFYFKQHVNGR